MGRLRKRLDGLEGHAHSTMSSADAKIERVAGLVEDFILDLQDGMGITLERTGEDSIYDFLIGKVDKLPLKVVIDISEDEPEV